MKLHTQCYEKSKTSYQVGKLQIRMNTIMDLNMRSCLAWSCDVLHISPMLNTIACFPSHLAVLSIPLRKYIQIPSCPTDCNST